MRADDPRFLSREAALLPGVKRALQVPLPAAGVDWQVIVPGGRQWRILGASALLVTSVTVANRFIALQYTDGQNVLTGNGVASPMTASLTVPVFYATTGLSNVGTASAPLVVVALPGLWLPPGTVIQSKTIGLQAGDQWSVIVLWFEEVYFDDQGLSSQELELLHHLHPAGHPHQPSPGGIAHEPAVRA